MSLKSSSKIEWTNRSWNPVRGCTKISPGCTHCYACTFAERFRGVKGNAYEQGFDLRLVPDQLAEPFGLPTPQKLFVNSMSDLFHKDVPDEYIIRICEVMYSASWHTYQVLTKRGERCRDLLNNSLSKYAQQHHIWWGVSVEDRKYGLPRIAQLQAAKCHFRWLSIEPLLEDIGELDLAGIHWVVVGGESGGHARPMQPAWVRPILAQCREQHVPFFFKQWGTTNKKKAGRLLDGKEYNEYPTLLEQQPPSAMIRKQLQGMSW